MNKPRRNRQSNIQILAVLLGVTMLLGTAQVSGSNLSQSTNYGDGRSAVAAKVASDQDDRVGRRTDYDPGEVYRGMFAADQLYRVMYGTEQWVGSRHPARVRDVSCRDARTALERRGTWNGQLNTNGTCGSGEPTDWATGNFLNFQAGVHDGGAS